MATDNVTSIRTLAQRSASIDLLENKLTQLSSLLTCTYGVGAEWFELIGKTHRDNILWLAADLAHESQHLLEESHRVVLAAD